MNKDIKDRWVAALRSGDYLQGRRALRRGDRFCCLGVLCEIAVEDGILTRGSVPDSDMITYHPDEEKADGYALTCLLDQKVVDWAGLSTDNPITIMNGDAQTLTGWNDSDEATFLQIADMIEEQL